MSLFIQYNNAFRSLSGLPRYCCASTMFACAEVDNFPAILRKKGGSLLQRVRDSVYSALKVIAHCGDCPLVKHIYNFTILLNMQSPGKTSIILNPGIKCRATSRINRRDGFIYSFKQKARTT